jgi:DNA-binding MarR family transcriptional regulator/GNAT superfamily N-acetyltransferase
MDFYTHAGELIFGTRLRRLSEKILMDVTKIYRSLDIPFETSWFPLFYLLNQQEKLSVTEIARELRITHSAISQLVSLLEKRKIIAFLNDENDRRKRLIAFTDKGRALMETISPVWDAIQRCMRGLFAERENSAYILTALSELEESIENQSLYERVLKDIQQNQLGDIEIRPLTSSDKEAYKNLILKWLIDFQVTQIADEDLINRPEIVVRQKGAIILLAKIRNESVGTIVAQINKNGNAEILYLVVDEKWQKRQIGKKLLKKAMQQLNAYTINTVDIHLDRRFSHAIKLFKEEGFVLQSVKSDEIFNNSMGTSLHLRWNLT